MTKSVRLDAEVAASVDAHAAKRGMSRTEMVNALLLEAMGSSGVVDRVKLNPSAELERKLLERIASFPAGCPSSKLGHIGEVLARRVALAALVERGQLLEVRGPRSTNAAAMLAAAEARMRARGETWTQEKLQSEARKCRGRDAVVYMRPPC